MPNNSLFMTAVHLIRVADQIMGIVRERRNGGAFREKST